MKSFWAGFEKRAAGYFNKADPGLEEDALVGLTSAIPLGTSIHSLVRKDVPEGKRMDNWLGRVALGIGGGLVGGVAGDALASRHSMGGARVIGTLLGGAGGEILANRLTRGTPEKQKGKKK